MKKSLALSANGGYNDHVNREERNKDRKTKQKTNQIENKTMNTEIINNSEITEENLEAWTMQELLELDTAPAWACAAMIVQGENPGEFAVKYYESPADCEQDMKQA